MLGIDRINDRITMFTFDQLRTSWLIRDRRSILIESGFPSNGAELLAGLEKISLTVRDIDFLALTHVHLDHAGGAGLIAQQNQDMKVFVHGKGARHLSNPGKLMQSVRKAYANNEIFSNTEEMVPIPKGQIIAVDSGDVIDLGDTQLEVSYTPGHAKHHVVYFDKTSESVFPGDALGSKFPGFPHFVLSPPADYDMEISKRSIDLIKGMNPKRIYFTHCGSYTVDEYDDFYEKLKTKHELWTDCVWEIARQNPKANSEKVFEIFLKTNKELEPYRSQYFSFRLSVKGILSYLTRNHNIQER